ncbi:MAG: hypothetical protein AAFY25_08570 [Pseudomonadota bacterium]
MRTDSTTERYIELLINAFDLGFANGLSLEWLIDRIEQTDRTDL